VTALGLILVEMPETRKKNRRSGGTRTGGTREMKSTKRFAKVRLILVSTALFVVIVVFVSILMELISVGLH
jgi:hypothetical protein